MSNQPIYVEFGDFLQRIADDKRKDQKHIPREQYREALAEVFDGIGPLFLSPETLDNLEAQSNGLIRDYQVPTPHFQQPTYFQHFVDHMAQFYEGVMDEALFQTQYTKTGYERGEKIGYDRPKLTCAESVADAYESAEDAFRSSSQIKGPSLGDVMAQGLQNSILISANIAALKIGYDAPDIDVGKSSRLISALPLSMLEYTRALSGHYEIEVTLPMNASLIDPEQRWGVNFDVVGILHSASTESKVCPVGVRGGLPHPFDETQGESDLITNLSYVVEREIDRFWEYAKTVDDPVGNRVLLDGEYDLFTGALPRFSLDAQVEIRKYVQRKMSMALTHALSNL